MTTIYFLILFLLILGVTQYCPLTVSYINNVSHPQTLFSRKTVCFIGFSILIILHTIVNPDFSDLHNYVKAVSTARNYSWGFILTHNIPDLKAEVGYRLLTKSVSTITTSPKFLLFVCGILMTIGYYKVVKEYSPMVVLSLLLIVTGPFIQSLFVVRQHITMSLLLLTYPLIINKKLVQFLIIIIIAYSIHQTALVFMPVYFLYHIKSNKKLVIISLVSLVILSIGLAFMLDYYNTEVASSTSNYNDKYLSESEEGSNYTMPLLMTLVLSLRIYFLRKNFFNNGITKLLSILVIFGTVFSFAGVGFVGTSRLFMCYTMTMFIVIPNTVSYIKDKNLQILIGGSYWLLTLLAMIKNSEWLVENDLYFSFL